MISSLLFVLWLFLLLLLQSQQQVCATAVVGSLATNQQQQEHLEYALQETIRKTAMEYPDIREHQIPCVRQIPLDLFQASCTDPLSDLASRISLELAICDAKVLGNPDLMFDCDLSVISTVQCLQQMDVGKTPTQVMRMDQSYRSMRGVHNYVCNNWEYTKTRAVQQKIDEHFFQFQELTEKVGQSTELNLLNAMDAHSALSALQQQQEQESEACKQQAEAHVDMRNACRLAEEQHKRMTEQCKRAEVECSQQRQQSSSAVSFFNATAHQWQRRDSLGNIMAPTELDYMLLLIVVPVVGYFRGMMIGQMMGLCLIGILLGRYALFSRHAFCDWVAVNIGFRVPGLCENSIEDDILLFWGRIVLGIGFLFFSPSSSSSSSSLSSEDLKSILASALEGRFDRRQEEEDEEDEEEEDEKQKVEPPAYQETEALQPVHKASTTFTAAVDDEDKVGTQSIQKKKGKSTTKKKKSRKKSRKR